MTFVPDFPIEKLIGVEYNPREITSDDESTLQASIRECGFCKPVIVTESGRLVAGHQRTNAARALGMSAVPAFVLREQRIDNEMRFNQLHNASDVDTFDVAVSVGPVDGHGFQEIDWRRIEGSDKQRGAGVRAEIYKLIARHGAWGCAVASTTGDILSGGQYALTCRMAKRPLRVFVVDDAKADAVRRYFGRGYGVFAYSKLPRKDYLQTFAQPYRIHADDPLVYRRLRPMLRKQDRILDFGCGNGDGAKALRADGYNVSSVEFFYRGGKHAIQTSAVHAMIDRMCAEMARGLYDVVICDAVVNSVNSLQAEVDVLRCVNGLCKPGGIITISGRSREVVSGRAGAESDNKADAGAGRKVEFIDPHGFSATPRGEDSWFFQKFHTKAQVADMARTYIGERFVVKHGGAWYVHGNKVADVAPDLVRESLAREFDLQWPAGRRVGRSAQILEAYAMATNVP